jgi:hypothetical protein
MVIEGEVHGGLVLHREANLVTELSHLFKQSCTIPKRASSGLDVLAMLPRRSQSADTAPQSARRAPAAIVAGFIG